MAAVLRLLPLTLAFCFSGGNLAAESREADLKAAFLFNFAQFVEWPASAHAQTNSPFVIGVLGTNPFGKTLEELVQGESIQGHPIAVRQFSSTDSIGLCHILFISASESSRLGEILQDLRNRPILTVGDMEAFARGGGMIRFITVQNRIRFRINLAAVREAGLTISSKLLRLAEVVEESPPR